MAKLTTTMPINGTATCKGFFKDDEVIFIDLGTCGPVLAEGYSRDYE